VQDGVAFGCVSQLSLWVLLRIRERLWLCVGCCLCLTVVAAVVAVVVVLFANAAMVIAIHINKNTKNLCFEMLTKCF